MKLYYLVVFILFISLQFSCSKTDDSEEYIPISPVTVDLTQVPYAKLSEYYFFDGEIKNQIPSLNVLPYEPASSLFTDYAHKKRFVWMPLGVKATFNQDNNVLELPVGAALIKTFYYNNVQNVTPVGASRIIETRLMIRKSTGWIFADYIWNDQQTEAFLDTTGNGGVTTVEWKDENNAMKSVNYRIPTSPQCTVCHNANEVPIPIGIKPQNLNYNYSYGSESKNQLTKWIEQGYLESNFTFPTAYKTAINYNDTSKSLEQRVRSYVDINCSHCHQTNGYCSYRPMRFAYSETATTDGLMNMGVCLDTQDLSDLPKELNKIVYPGSINKSMMYYRMNTEFEGFKMPLLGRTIVHKEAVDMVEQWINSLEPCN